MRELTASGVGHERLATGVRALFLPPTTIRLWGVRYVKKNQMVRIMRNLAYILISAFCLVCFCSCSIGEGLQARIEKKRLNDEFEFSLDSIRKIASAYTYLQSLQATMAFPYKMRGNINSEDICETPYKNRVTS